MPIDTELDVVRRQVAQWRSMTPLERAELADKLSADVAVIARAGIRFDMPGASPEAVRHELARRRYGRTVADAAYGVAPLE
jgi:hypothetical protein